jgi:uncharacterized protein (TIGR03437 family)
VLKRWIALAAFLVVAGGLPLQPAESPSGRYAVILQDPPVGSFAAGQSPQAVRGSAAVEYEAKVLAAQASMRSQIESRGVRVTGAVQTLLNAVFVEASEAEAAQIRTMPGVSGVVPVKRFSFKLNRALPLMNVAAAWTKLGGVGNAGAGIKIAIIDSGIDQNHPAFQDASLSIPAGYPRCTGLDCNYTNNKVIAARSYIAQLGAGAPGNPAAESRPDDVSPRDHLGHGTALAMIAAGQTNTGPAATITGVAPKAWLGSYKVFGSPGVNDYTSGDVIIKALEDALSDGMNIASLSIGSPAFYGPLDTGATCGQNAGVPCDTEAMAVENAVKAGMLVVVAAGNEGDIGSQAPTLGTVGSPADAPSAIAVGATTNSHTFTESLHVLGSAVPANLQLINALFGDGAIPSTPVTARLIDVTTLGNNGLACTSLPANSLTGAIALIQRGTCNFSAKALNALSAGAVGIVFYQSAGLDDLLVPSGLTSISIPAVMIGYTNGVALKSYLAANPGTQVSLDPAIAEQLVSTYNTIASFSSRGPVIGGASMKPDMVAVGTDVYMAAQTYDPNGFLYDATGYSFASGTSFSTPMVAGAAALVLQANPGFTPAQVKSALANTATQDVTDGGVTAGANSVGAGKLDAGAAVQTSVAVTPPTVYFGALAAGQRSVSKALTLTNTGTSPVNLTFSVTARAGNPITLSKNSLALSPGQSGTVNAILSGSVSAGFYDGGIAIQGAQQALRVPYGYAVGDGVPADIIPISGDCFEGLTRGAMTTGPLGFELVDHFGVPVSGRTVQFGVTSGGGSIQNPDPQTDSFGIAMADATLGPRAGSQQSFFGQAGGLSFTYIGDVRVQPAIMTNGAVNAASFTAAGGAAPGSYLALFGTGLSDLALASSGPNLMPALIGGNEQCGGVGVSVSFYVPAAKLSVPGYMIYVSPNQVNVLLPWELSGQSSAQMKVSIGTVSGAVYTLPLATYSPGVYEYLDQGTNQLLAIGLDDTGMLIGSASAALRGHVVKLYLNGLGPVDQPPPSGHPVASAPPVNTLAQPTVTIGGSTATVQFSGLSPLAPALYEIDFVVPSNAPTGVQPLAVSIGGAAAAVSKMPVQ